MVFHFFNVPTAADAQNHSAIRDHVERGHFLGQYDWIALYEEANTSAKLDLFRGDGGGRQRDELIVGMRILLRKLPAARPGVLRLIGICVCSVKNKESRPRSSTACANSTGWIE
jgi:hypothetical protein